MGMVSGGPRPTDPQEALWEWRFGQEEKEVTKSPGDQLCGRNRDLQPAPTTANPPPPAPYGQSPADTLPGAWMGALRRMRGSRLCSTRAPGLQALP